jgi:hypothetical protein
MGKREAMVPEDLQPKTGMVICLGEEVGDTIDLKERNHYRLFLTSKNFHSAVILQLTGKEHYVVQITQKQSGEGQYRQATLPMDKSTLKKLRRYIHYFDKLVPAARDRLFTREDSAVLGFEKSTKPVSENLSRRKETLGKTKISEAMVWKLEEQAKILAKEKWSKERWREEMLNDRGGNYRLAGGILGGTLGSATGMLIGKALQGKKVARQEIHQEDLCLGLFWCDIIITRSWTENFYSYKHRHAPHWGAVIGGTAGIVAGYFLGKKADKRYYNLVPKHIRMEEVQSSWVWNCILGFGIVGPVMGIISESALYTPNSDKEGDESFGGSEFTGGYLIGSITGTIMIAALKKRAKHKELWFWKKSLVAEKPGGNSVIEFMPLDPTAFNVHYRILPNGETYYEYQIDLVRVRF